MSVDVSTSIDPANPPPPRAPASVGAAKGSEGEGAGETPVASEARAFSADAPASVPDGSARDRGEQTLRATTARLRLLADAGRVFAGPLDEATALAMVPRLAVPRLGDACRVDLIDGTGRSQRVACECTGDVAIPAGPDDDGPAALLRARPDSVLVRTDDMLGSALRDRLTAWCAHAVAAVPLIVRGRLVGAVTLVVDDRTSPPSFGDDELALLEEIARRAASALEQTRLLAEARAARAEAEAANRAKSQFLATMSHELRTPLNAILGYADLLDAGIGGPIEPTQQHYLGRIRGRGQHLLGLIEDVLDFARLEAGQLTVVDDVTPTAATVEQALALVRPLADARGVRLAVHQPVALRYCGDGDRVRQILVNLIGNAIKFTAAGGLVTVECSDAMAIRTPAGGVVAIGNEVPLAAPLPSIVPPQRGWVTFQVRDTGIGIPPDKLGSVFDPFVQIDATSTRTSEGTGLGLAISRELARRMNGELTVASRPGVGSAFALWLPGAPPSPAVENAPGIAIGRALTRHLGVVIAKLTDRLRADPQIPLGTSAAQSDLENHLATLLADLAQHFVIFDERGVDAVPLIRDGIEFQHQIAEKHGRQRRRLGWDESALRREFALLDEVLGGVIRRELTRDDDSAHTRGELVDELLGVVRAFLTEALAGSLVGFHAMPPDPCPVRRVSPTT